MRSDEDIRPKTCHLRLVVDGSLTTKVMEEGGARLRRII